MTATSLSSDTNSSRLRQPTLQSTNDLHEWKEEFFQAVAFCDFVERMYRDDAVLAVVASAARGAVIGYYDAESGT